MRTGALVLLCLLAAGLAACGSGGGDTKDKPKPKLRVVATTPQVADFLRAVGGSRLDVRQLVANRVDADTYHPTAGDRKTLEDADMVVRSGGIDDWLPGLARQADVPDARIVDLSKAVILRELRGRVDFRWWQDPRNAAAAVLKLRDELIKRDNDGSRPYRAAAARYRAKLARLDRAAAHCFAGLSSPKRHAGIITPLDHFGYLGARYLIAISLPTDDRAASPAPVGFGEHGVDVRPPGMPAGIAGILWGDTLSSGEDSPAARYLGAMRSNLRAVAAGLGADCRIGD